MDTQQKTKLPENNFIEISTLYAIASQEVGAPPPANLLISTIHYDKGHVLAELDRLAYTNGCHIQFYLISIAGGDCITGECGVKEC